MSDIIEKHIGDFVAKFHTRSETGYDVTVTDEIVIREIFDENVYETPFDYMQDKIVLDIGANIGAYSIYCALGGATVHAYELTDDYNYDMLLENIKLNNLEDKIKTYKLGVYKNEGLHTLINGQGASFIDDVKHLTPEAKQMLDDIRANTQSIETITLQQAVSEVGKIIDICKIDIEGSEYGLFESATKTAMKKIKFITMEFHQTDDTTYGKMLAKLQHTHNIHAFGNPQLGGQIIARRY